jgi:transcriptional regulator with XRE-family HTH domain
MMNTRVARLSKSMSQEELARIAGIPQPYISLHERDRRPLGEEHVKRVAAVLGLSHPTAESR